MGDSNDRALGGGRLVFRAAIGLTQGLALYGLFHWRQLLDPVAFGALWTASWLAPIVLIGSLGALNPRLLALWTMAATATAAGLGGYDAFVHHSDLWPPHGSLSPVIFFVAATLYILHHFVVPAAVEGRWRASYERYFDEAWMDAVRLALAALFVGLLWAMLWLGAALFKLIGLSFLQELINREWFAYPTATTFFALAVHLTDVRVTLVRGARFLLLTLLSWLLIVMTVIAVAFLAALPFAGLSALSAAGSASGTMLAVCATLIVLINATYQEGEREGYPPAVLKWAGRVASLALVPLTGVAAYGLALRIGQYGLTPERISVGACMLVAACYASGYAWAAVRRGPWMARLEGANWLTGQVAIALLLTLFSPLADPARISVDSQLKRLEAGTVAPDKFDYKFLRFDSGRWGREELQNLSTMTGSSRATEIASLARLAQAQTSPWMDLISSPSREAVAYLSDDLRIYPTGARVPETFLEQAAKSAMGGQSSCFNKGARRRCDLYVLDIYGEGTPAILVVAPDDSSDARVAAEIFRRQNGGPWAKNGELVVMCAASIKALQAGTFSFTAPKARDIVLAGRPFNILSVPDYDCSMGETTPKRFR